LKIDSGWEVTSSQVVTQVQAYMGIRAERKAVLKRNSSPFLAALQEGFTPRLVWTKRIGNGEC